MIDKKLRNEETILVHFFTEGLPTLVKRLVELLGPIGVVLFIGGAALSILRQDLLVQFKIFGSSLLAIIYWTGPILLTIAAMIAALRYLRNGGHSIIQTEAEFVSASQSTNFIIDTPTPSEKADVQNGDQPDLSSQTSISLFREAIDQQCRVTRGRLTKEISALSRRGNLNLVIGMVISIVGICYLGWKMFDAPHLQTINRDLLVYFIPRATFTILIEAVAFFFLNLYRTSLHEIKYFQNELTNIEARLLAVSLMFYPGDTNVLSNIALDLLKTERNFILQKGQTTVDLEREKLVGSMIKDNIIAFKHLLGQKETKD